MAYPGGTRILLSGVVALTLGCDRHAGQASAPNASPPLARSLASSGFVDPPQSLLPRPVTDSGTRDGSGGATQLPPTVAHFFAEYKDGTDFAFMRADCAPTLERFVTLRNVPVATVIRDAKTFFHDKVKLSAKPDLTRAYVEPLPDGGSSVHLPLTMAWGYPIPPRWGSDWPNWEESSAPDAPPHIWRRVEVNVTIDLTAEGKIFSYAELGTVSPKLRVTGEENCDVSDLEDRSEMPRVVVRKGEIVDDLGETVVVSENPKGPHTARKVRANGRIGWTMDSVFFAIPNLPWGTSAGESSCLASVADAGSR